MSRKHNYEDVAGKAFNILQNDDGTWPVDQIQLLLLQDIRAELLKLNARLGCIETLRIPRYLKRIASNTAKPRAKKR